MPLCNKAQTSIPLFKTSLGCFILLLKMQVWTFHLNFCTVSALYSPITECCHQLWHKARGPQCHGQRPPSWQQFQLNLAPPINPLPSPRTTGRCMFNLVPLFKLGRGYLYLTSVYEAWAPRLALSVTKLHTFTLIETRGAPACCLLLQP